MKQYRIRYEVTIVNGLGYHVRNEMRDRIIQAEDIPTARRVFEKLEEHEIYDVMEMSN